jgi:hypothetical protein
VLSSPLHGHETPNERGEPVNIRTILVVGGAFASAILIVFGIFAVVLGAQGRNEVRSSLVRENIVGSSDMSPKAIKAEAKQAGLPASIPLPTCTVADQVVNSGTRAKCFADYMRIHALEASAGKTYSELDRYLGKNGQPTSDKAKAAIDPLTKQPVSNPARDTWLQEIALTDALNTSYFAENVGNFGIVMGIALLLSGIGFAVLTFGALRRPLGE